MQLILNALVLGSIYALFALGFTLIWGTLKLLNFAHGAILVFSIFVVWKVQAVAQIPLYLVLLIGLLVGGAASVLTELVFRYLRSRGGDHWRQELIVLIVSIGFAEVFTGIISAGTQGAPFTLGNLLPRETVTIGSLTISNLQATIVLTAVVLTSAMAATVRWTRAGRALRAVATDSSVAGLMGIDARRVSTVTMFVGGAMAGVAGILLALYFSSVDTATGNSLLLKAFAAIIIGGVGSIPGALIGATLLATTETVVIATTSGAWVDAVAFGVIILFLLILPRGLFASATVDRV